MDVRIRRVSSTHASRGRLSRRSDISSIGDRWVWEGATNLRCCWGSRVGFAGLTALVSVAFLGPCLSLGADLTSLPFLVVGVTFTRLGVVVTVTGAGLGEDGVAALTTRPPRTTWFQPEPRLCCSAEGSAG
jgi:hypothetical protein